MFSRQKILYDAMIVFEKKKDANFFRAKKIQFKFNLLMGSIFILARYLFVCLFPAKKKIYV